MSKPELSREELGRQLLTAAGTYRSVRGLAIILAVVLLLLIIATGLGDVGWSAAISVAPVLIVIWLGAVGTLTLFVHLMKVRVFEKGIEGRSFAGFRRRLLWQDIADMRLSGAGGFHALVLVEADTGRELWMLREILDREDFRAATDPHLDWQKLQGG